MREDHTVFIASVPGQAFRHGIWHTNYDGVTSPADSFPHSGHKIF